MKKNNNYQNGQSLIETIGAIFILVTGLTVLVGVTIYAFSRSDVSSREVVATNLAREGLDVIRKMRDTNWLSNEATFGPCADIGHDCYPGVFRAAPHDLDASATYSDDQRYRVQPNTPFNNWQAQGNGNRWDRIRLFTSASGLFSHDIAGAVTDYARQIIISYDTAAPYSVTNPAMNVKSIVVWNARGCPTLLNTTANVNLAATSGAQAFNTACKIIVEETMTNWKDY